MLLVAMGLCAGSVSAWGVTYNSTATGIVGATDNSSGFNVVGSKSMSLTAGDEYVITFVNYNKGAEGTNYWANWAFISDVFSCRADHGESNPYWGSATNVNYTGNSWTDISSTISEWLQAYNGVTVTLTVSRNAAGDGITISHTATTKAVGSIASQTFEGTFTATVDAATAINFYLTVENAHLNITNVVYTNASGDVIHYDLGNVDLSKFDSYFSGSYSDGIATFVNSSNSKVWAKLALSDYFENINGTITNVNMKFTENVGSGGRIAIGIYGNNKSSWANNAYQDADNSVSVWGIVGSNYTNRIYYSSSSTYVTGLTYGSAASIAINMDVINKKFSWIQDGTTKVNNQSYVSTDVTLPQYVALYSWSNDNTTSLADMTMEIVYVEASYYTATFTNTTSGNAPSVTIYTDSERKSEISNGLLENGVTYYFTAKETGYQNYNGSFAVSGTDPSVSFAMTAKTVYNYTVNAVDGNSNILSSNILSGTCYAGETTSFYLPACVLVDGTLHFMGGENSYKSETVTTNNQVFSYEYTNSTVDNVVFFVEGENIGGASKSTPTNMQSLASEGYMGRGSNLEVTTLPAGSYTIYVHYVNTNSSGQSVVVKAGEADVINNSSVTVRPTISGSITLTSPTAITLTAAASSTSGVDYLYIVKTGEAATIGEHGYATFSSTYALDFSNVTALKAYIVTSGNASTVTMEQVKGTVAANTGLVIKGESASIPIVASGTDYSSTNKLWVWDSDWGSTVSKATDDNYTNYVLSVQSGKVVFAPIGDTPAPINHGQAVLTLPTPSSQARSLNISFGDEASGISTIEAETLKNTATFNLSGQRVSKPGKGLYIVNGKKVMK